MQFPRLLPGDGQFRPLPSPDQSNVGSLGATIKQAGKEMDRGIDVYAHYDARARVMQAHLDAVEKKASLDTATEIGFADATRAGAEQTLKQEELFRSGQGDATQYMQTMGQVQADAFQLSADKIQNVEVRRAVTEKLAKQQAASFTEWKKSHVALIEERARGVQAGKDQGYQLQIDQAKSPDDILAVADSHRNDWMKMSQLGIVSRAAALAESAKFTKEARTNYFERQMNTNPEAVNQALSPMASDADKLFLAQTDQKVLSSVIATMNSRAQAVVTQGRASQEWNDKQRDKRQEAVGELLQNQVEAGDPSVTREFIAQQVTDGSIDHKWQTKLYGIMEHNADRGHTALVNKRAEDLRILTEKREVLGKQFWSSIYAGKPITGAMRTELQKTMSENDFKAISKAMQDVKDAGGHGDPRLTNERELDLTRNSNAYSEVQIWEMKNLNLVQRQKLYETKAKWAANEKAAAADPNHFTKHADFKNFHDQIGAQMSINMSNPLTTGAEAKAESDAKLEYRELYEKELKAGKTPDGEALMNFVAKRWIKATKRLSNDKPPAYDNADALKSAFVLGEITVDQYEEEAVLLRNSINRKLRKERAAADESLNPNKK